MSNQFVGVLLPEPTSHKRYLCPNFPYPSIWGCVSIPCPKTMMDYYAGGIAGAKRTDSEGEGKNKSQSWDFVIKPQISLFFISVLYSGYIN